MNKLKGMLARLPAEQQNALETWLFDSPALTYQEARERLQREFGVETTVVSLCRYYQRRSRERLLDRVVSGGRETIAAWGQLGQQPAKPFEALMEMIGRTAFELQTRNEELPLGDLKDLTAVAALGLRAHAEGARVRIREKDLAVRRQGTEIRNRDVKLKEKKYQDHLELIEKTGGHPVTRGILTEEALEEMVTAANFL